MKIDIKKLYNLTQDLDVLYVEDDLDFAEQTSEILNDFSKSVDLAYDGVQALDCYNNYYIKNNKYYDIVVSDINMPKMNGITLSKEIYKINENQPIIIVSAYNETEHLVELINIGVKRFLQKPFKQDSLLEVLYFVLSKKFSNKEVIKLSKDITWDSKDETLKKENENIKLTKKELDILKLLLKNGSKISTTQEIVNTIWYDDPAVGADSLKMHISRLRKKLQGVGLEVVYNIGYRLNF